MPWPMASSLKDRENTPRQERRGLCDWIRPAWIHIVPATGPCGYARGIRLDASLGTRRCMSCVRRGAAAAAKDKER